MCDLIRGFDLIKVPREQDVAGLLKYDPVEAVNLYIEVCKTSMSHDNKVSILVRWHKRQQQIVGHLAFIPLERLYQVWVALADCFASKAVC